jgi:uncharacterized protein (TIGR02147 family)
MKPLTFYVDYRAYLNDWYEQRRINREPASNRWIAQKMQINSASWFTNVRTGKLGLSKSTANKLSAVLRHSEIETRYFENLVSFNQAKTTEESNRYFNELTLLRAVYSSHIVQADEYEYFSSWYHPVVRAIIEQIRFKDDYETLASILKPPITAAQAKKSVELMEKIGLIKKDSDGYYIVTNAAITTGEHERSLAVINYQHETMRLAQEAIDRFKKCERDISTLTIGIAYEDVEAIKSILAEARRKIVQIAVADKKGDSVYQVNMQLFPLCRIDVNKKR